MSEQPTANRHDFILPDGADGRPIALDITLPEGAGPFPVIVYAHGFNGFKDWGGTGAIASDFAAAGFAFVKFNFSHNGTTPETPEDFSDLEAYSRNTYTKELQDLRTVINWVSGSQSPFAGQVDAGRLALLGHSRGGGIVLIAAAEEERVRAVITWASVAACKTPWGSWPEEKMAAWKKSGVAFIANARTGQQMPLRYSLYEDYRDNSARLDLERAVRALKQPLLICHGTEDTSVPPAAATAIHSWKPGAELFLLPTDHVGGRRHPWTEERLPEATLALIDRSVRFLTQVFSVTPR